MTGSVVSVFVVAFVVALVDDTGSVVVASLELCRVVKRSVVVSRAVVSAVVTAVEGRGVEAGSVVFRVVGSDVCNTVVGALVVSSVVVVSKDVSVVVCEEVDKSRKVVL